MQTEKEASGDSTYLECTARKISSLQELKPGDHIAVMGTYMEGIITYKHHLLVVEVVNDKIVAIHKKLDVSVVEGTVDYRADEITVLDYDCPYTGQNERENGSGLQTADEQLRALCH